MPGLVIPAERSIIVAADVEPEKYYELVEGIGAVKGISGYKIGFEVALGITLAAAVEVVRNVDESAVAIYDHQKAGNDIPDTGVNFARTMVRGGVDAAIVFPFNGPQVEESWIRELQQKNIGVIFGSEMTHKQQRHSEGGYIADDAFLKMFSQAVALGVKDFVVPGNKPEKVQEYREFFDEEVGEGEYSLFAPGFVAQGGEISETGQAAGKSWHAIIGRGITQAADMRGAAIEHTQQILNRG
jgi:orotidine-5'-phosphate decarboxylase